MEVLTWWWRRLYLLESPGFFLRIKMLLRALFCFLLGLPHSLACLHLLCDCVPTLVLLGFLPLAYLGRLIQPFQLFHIFAPQNKAICPFLFQSSLFTCRQRVGEEGSRWTYKQRWDNFPDFLGVSSYSGLLFLHSYLWVGEAHLAALPSGPPFLRSRKTSSRILPLCSLMGLNVFKKNDRCVSISEDFLNSGSSHI